MGTKIQANAFLREYRSVIDLDGATSNGMRSVYHENKVLKNGKSTDSFMSYDLEKVRQTILEHESVFKNQLQELHRLYERQQELMNEIKRREINKDDGKEETCHASYLFSSIPPQDAKRTCKLFPGFVEEKSVPLFPTTQDERSLRSCGSRLLNSTIFPHLGFPSDVYSSNTENQTQGRFPKLPVVESTRKHQTSQHKADDSTFDLNFKMNSNPGDGIRDGLTLARGEIYANSCSNFNLATKDFFQNFREESSLSMMELRKERSQKEHLSDEYAEKRRFEKHCSVGDSTAGKSVAFPQSLLAESTKEFPNRPRKKKIFGVEISMANDDLFIASSNMSSNLNPPHEENDHVCSLESSSWIANSFVRNVELRGANLNDGKNERLKEYPKGALPWFLRNSQVNGDLSNGRMKSSYFMNLDSLQNCSQKIFGSFEKQKNKISASMAAQDAEGRINEVNDGVSSKRIPGFPISDVLIGGDCARKVEDVPRNHLEKNDDSALHRGSNNYISDLRQHIDLNLSLDEEDAPSPPSLTTAIVKIATTDIDLEAPAVIEPETKASPIETNSELPYEESDKIAAEAMISISLLSMENKLVDNTACEQAETTSSACLRWFAEIISSQHGDVSTNQSRLCDGEEFVPDGMDYFEFMTLKLEETKEQHYNYSPFVLNNHSDDEARAALTKRSRRGQSRRGRQRKDFQRDILPGLVTLSRLELTEDLQAFEELLKGSNLQSRLSNRSSTRNARGRKRLGASPTVKTGCSTEAQKPICQLEGRSLTGWGKKTRRLPRQRCANSFLAFPVKC